MAARTIVYDTTTVEFLGNRILDREYAARFPGASATVELHDQAVLRGWQMMAADTYLALPATKEPAVLLTERMTPRTRQLHERGVVPSVVMNGESPNIAWGFYHRLDKQTARFHHAFLFRGFRHKVKAPTVFHPYYWPNAQREVAEGVAWNERRLLVMIAANKQRFPSRTRGVVPATRRLARMMTWMYLQAADPTFRFEDLYSMRRAAISHFSGRLDFCLYGWGWDQRSEWESGAEQEAIRKAWGGPLGDEGKAPALRTFKYAVCFENCAFPGYVTEKVFDCFFAGCVPIYLGAPDITDFVPPETFIDCRKFRGLADLEEFVTSLAEPETRRYREAARDFLASPSYGKFHQDALVSELLAVFEEESARHG
jgi:hypothetical protein